MAWARRRPVCKVHSLQAGSTIMLQLVLAPVDLMLILGDLPVTQCNLSPCIPVGGTPAKMRHDERHGR